MSETIKIGYPPLPAAAGAASVVARLLEAHGVEPEYVDLEPEEIGEKIFTRIDILIPDRVYGSRLASFAEAERLGVLYHDRFRLFRAGCEGHCEEPEKVVVSRSDRVVWEALTKEGNFPKTLAALPVVFLESAEIRSLLEKEKREPFYLALHEPHEWIHEFALQTDPGCDLPDAGQEMRIAVGRDLERSLSPDLLDELGALLLDGRIMSAFAHTIGSGVMEPEEAAEAWQRGKLIGR